VPPGNYLIHGSLIGEYTDTDDQTINCAINTNPPSAVSGEGTSNRSHLSQSPSAISFQEAATFAQTTVITMNCSGFMTIAAKSVLSALSVGSCHSSAGANCGFF
jgi:hypothetical protein